LVRGEASDFCLGAPDLLFVIIELGTSAFTEKHTHGEKQITGLIPIKKLPIKKFSLWMANF
jgi:hypothetical protein